MTHRRATIRRAIILSQWFTYVAGCSRSHTGWSVAGLRRCGADHRLIRLTSSALDSVRYSHIGTWRKPITCNSFLFDSGDFPASAQLDVCSAIEVRRQVGIIPVRISCRGRQKRRRRQRVGRPRFCVYQRSSVGAGFATDSRLRYRIAIFALVRFTYAGRSGRRIPPRVATGVRSAMFPLSRQPSRMRISIRARRTTSAQVLVRNSAFYPPVDEPCPSSDHHAGGVQKCLSKRTAARRC
jgi:hypothetical protein